MKFGLKRAEKISIRDGATGTLIPDWFQLITVKSPWNSEKRL